MLRIIRCIHIKKEILQYHINFYDKSRLRTKNNNNFTPVAVYENPDLQQDQIYYENKGKSGVYRWTNLINGKTYIGSYVDLPNRLSNYYSKKNMETQLNRGKSAI